MNRIKIMGLGLALGATMAYAGTLTVDLTKTGEATLSGGTTTGSIFQATSAPTTVGTGNIDSFLRVQANGTEEGYNTDAKNPGIESDVGGNFTHSITLADLDATSHPGFYTFLLDINQIDSKSLLSMEELQLFYGTNGSISTQPGAPTGGLTKVWDFKDATSCSAVSGSAACSTPGAPNELLLDYTNNKGSGNGFDMFFFVPTSVFAGASPSSFIYLYTAFGGKGGDFASNDGFEEWARLSGTGQVPEPSYLSGLAVGAILLFLADRRRRQRLSNPV